VPDSVDVLVHVGSFFHTLSVPVAFSFGSETIATESAASGSAAPALRS